MRRSKTLFSKRFPIRFQSQSPIIRNQYPALQLPHLTLKMPTVLETINLALHQAMAEDERVYVLGEDILDDYGGAFKVTRGLSSAFPGRVLATPISEAGFTGLATGMALRGLRPVVEIMFGDFVTLAADQIINHAAKFRWMYNDQVSVPLVIRTPMGGRRGYGPTHSQTLEKHFLGTPGLRVLAACTLGDPGALLKDAILHGQDPTLFIENKLLYLLPVQHAAKQAEFQIVENPTSASRNTSISKDRKEGFPSTQFSPTYSLTIQGAPAPKLTLAAYGYMAELARQAVLKLAYEDEIFVELIVPTQLAPFALDPLLESVDRTGRLLAIEEGSLSLGWGAEVVAQASEALEGRLRSAHRLGAQDLPIPASRPLEDAILPSLGDIMEAARNMV
jgi:pyruvate/2-oxoglutarate/acetoin dehydrogenase E1 component